MLTLPEIIEKSIKKSVSRFNVVEHGSKRSKRGIHGITSPETARRRAGIL
jgi:hypothetical protein